MPSGAFGFSSPENPNVAFPKPFKTGTMNVHPTGRSAAWLARLPWEQEVGGSNPLAPIELDTAHF